MKRNILILVVVFVLGISIGYFGKPSRVVEKTIEVERTDTNENRNNNIIVTRIETVTPDGTHRIEVKTEDKSTIVIDTKTDSMKAHEKIVENKKNSLLVYGIGAVNVSNTQPGVALGAGVHVRVLGPIWVGGYGTSKKEAAITAGLSF